MRKASVAHRSAIGGALAVGMVFALLGAAAWACVPQARITLNPTSGGVGTNVTVSGSNFTPEAVVKLWWGGVGKQLLATTTAKADRTFSAAFNVPQANSGHNVVSASQYDSGGKAVGSPANATFKVEGQQASRPSNQQAQPSDADGSAGLEPAPSQSQQGSTAPSQEARSTRPATRTAQQPARSAQPARRVAAARTASAAAPAANAAPAAAAAPAPAMAPAPAVEAPAQAAPESSESFAAPAQQVDGTESSRRSTPLWALAGLGLLSLGFFTMGTAIYLNERKRVRAQA